MSTTPHDAFFKFLASSPAVAADIIRALVARDAPAVAAAIDWDSLEQMPAEFVDERLRLIRADILYRVRIHGFEGYVFVLLEHQSTIVTLMAFRILAYMVGVWRAWLDQNSGASKLPLIVPLVIYNGERAWSAPTDFTSLIDAPAEVLASLRAYVPTFDLLLDDLSLSADDVVEADHRLALAIAGLLALKHGHGIDPDDPVIERLAHHLGVVSALPGGLEAIRPALYYCLTTAKDPAVSRRLLSLLPGPAQEVQMSVAEMLREEGREEGREAGREEGREAGREEGREEGFQLALLEAIRQRFGPPTADVVERIHAASPADRSRWFGRIFTAETVDALFGG